MQKVESFELAHTKVKAPFVSRCCVLIGKSGDKVSKFDIRFKQPNADELESQGIHTLEHFMATFMREKTDDIIDLSPMGCRTGFYLTIWGEHDVSEIIDITNHALSKILEQTEIPSMNEIQCGNYRLHSLELAKKYASEVLTAGLSDKIYR